MLAEHRGTARSAAAFYFLTSGSRRTFGHKTLYALVKSRPESFRIRTEETKGGTSAIDVQALD